MKVILDIDDYDAGGIIAVGSANCVTNELDEVAESRRRLHDAIKEVTGKEVEPAPRRRIGFLP